VRLKKEEAICLVLAFSKNNEISSKTKLNKLLARLNLFAIPIDFDFSLNKYGSCSVEIDEIEDTNYYGSESYSYQGRQVTKFYLKDEGRKLYNETVKPKLQKILTPEEFMELREKIYSLSQLKAEDISTDEHRRLLVDIEDRYKLIQTVNAVYIDIMELYEKINEIPEHSFANIKLRGLIEYCYYLSKFFKEKRFKRIGDEYDFGAYMFDYYLLFFLIRIIPFLKEQMVSKVKDDIRINRYYNFLMVELKDKHPFSLENKDLKELVR